MKQQDKKIGSDNKPEPIKVFSSKNVSNYFAAFATIFI